MQKFYLSFRLTLFALVLSIGMGGMTSTAISFENASLASDDIAIISFVDGFKISPQWPDPVD